MVLYAIGRDMRALASNQDLYEYLLQLLADLRSAGADGLADSVAFAASQAPSASTEFLGESRIALRKVLDQEGGALGRQERTQLLNVIEQLNQVLDRR